MINILGYYYIMEITSQSLLNNIQLQFSSLHIKLELYSLILKGYFYRIVGHYTFPGIILLI